MQFLAVIGMRDCRIRLATAFSRALELPGGELSSDVRYLHVRRRRFKSSWNFKPWLCEFDHDPSQSLRQHKPVLRRHWKCVLGFFAMQQ